MSYKKKMDLAAEMGVMSTEAHGALSRNPERWLKLCGIDIEHLTTKGSDALPAKVVEILRIYPEAKAQGCRGFFIGGKVSLDMAQHITGAFLRNLISVRLVPLADVIHLQTRGELERPTCLVIPDIYEPATSIAKWEIKDLHAALYGRATSEYWTIGLTPDLAGCLEAYGQTFKGITTSWTRVKV